MTRARKLSLIATTVAALAVGAVAEDAAHWIGAAPSHRSVERYDMSLGVTAAQQPRRPGRIEENREVLAVPGHYGALVGVTGDPQTAVLWYRDADGSLRNVVVRDAATRTVKLVCAPTSRYEADAREDAR
jgi:hypothetical protein